MAAGKGKAKQEVPQAGTVIELFEEAVRAFNDADYERVLTVIEALEASYPEDLQILARARQYKNLCAKKIEAARDNGKSAKDSDTAFDLGVFHMNNGDYDQAHKQFEQALSLTKDGSAHIHYAVAALELRKGEEGRALKALGKAIELEGSFRHSANHDPDFEALFSNDAFRQLVECASA